MVTFFLTLYSMVYTLCVLMELKFGITSLLISETLHQLQTLRKNQRIAFGVLQLNSLIMLVLYGTLYDELSINVLWALYLSVQMAALHQDIMFVPLAHVGLVVVSLPCLGCCKAVIFCRPTLLLCSWTQARV